MKFRILHSNDCHSNFEAVSRIKTLIDENRDASTLVFDAGDFVDFKRIEYLGTKGELAGKLLSACHYDALCIGNNETFQGIHTLEHMSIFSNVPILSCNLEKKDGLLNGVLKYTILERGGIRFIVFGITTYMKVFLPMMGYGFKDYYEEIPRILKQEKGNYDLSIILSHVGTLEDEVIASKIHGIDIIISGHDHALYKEAKMIFTTFNSSAGYMGEALGILDFDYHDGQLALLDSKIVSTKNAPMNEEVLELVQKEKVVAISNLSQPLYEIKQALPHDFIDESPMGNFIADAIKDLLKTDVAIINSGIVNGGIPKGAVTEKKLIDISPSPLNPTTFEIKGRDILKALELSLDTDVCLNPGKGAGFRGICAGTLNVSGMIVYYHQTKIKKVLINGEPLDEDRWYKIASSDYLQRGSGYAPFINNRNYSYHVDYFRDTIREYLKREDFINNAHIKRWIELK